MYFKKCAKVRCLADYKDQFTKGKIYKILGVTDDWCSIEADDSGKPNGWGTRNFELIEEETPQKQAELALPGVIEFMEQNNLKNMSMTVDKYEITIKVKE